MSGAPVLSPSPKAVVICMEGDVATKARARSFIDHDSGRIRHRTPKATRSYEKALKLAAMVAMRRAGLRELQGPLAMTIFAYLPVPSSWSKKKRAAALAGVVRPTTHNRNDWDNIGKIASDALNKAVYHDDAQVVDGRTLKFYSDRPRIRIEVTEVHTGTEAA